MNHDGRKTWDGKCLQKENKLKTHTVTTKSQAFTLKVAAMDAIKKSHYKRAKTKIITFTCIESYHDSTSGHTEDTS